MKSVSKIFKFKSFQNLIMNRKNRKQQRIVEKKMNNMIRQLCCWNCFQVGHKRFQCPFAKQICCSFCRKPSIRSVECGCELSREYVGLHNHRQNYTERNPSYDEDVLVPVVNDQNGAVKYKRNDNLLIFVDNTQNQN